MAVVTIRQLLDSGVHFGHQTRRWNPKVKRFILTERSGIHIIDLQQSLTYIDKAYEFVKETVAHGGTVLFVGTKKQAQEVIAEQATRVGQPYVNQRWLGGLLTNFQTVSKRLARMKELEELDYENPADSGFTKKELLLKKRELDKLHKSLGGIRNLTKTPSAIWVVDAKREHLAINEASKLGIPVIGILDTNADPDEFQYPIPGNDDAIRSVGLLTRIIADAAAEGLIQRHQPTDESADAEPLADWERELLEQSAAEEVAERSSPRPSSRLRPPRASRSLEVDVVEVVTETADGVEVEVVEVDVVEAPAEDAGRSKPPPPPFRPAGSRRSSARPAGHPRNSPQSRSRHPWQTSRSPTSRRCASSSARAWSTPRRLSKRPTATSRRPSRSCASRARRATRSAPTVPRARASSPRASRTARSRSSSSPARPTSSRRTTASSPSPTRSRMPQPPSPRTRSRPLSPHPPAAQTVAQLIDDEAAIIGEKVELRRVRTLSGDKFEVYLHKTSKDLPAAGRRRPRLHGRRRGDRAQPRAAHLVREPDVPDPRRGPRGRRRQGARDRHRDLPQRGQARGCSAEDRRRPRQRVLQAGRSARPGLREGQQAVRRAGRQERRADPHGLRPLQGRRVTR